MSRDSSCGPSTAVVLLPLALVVPPRPAGRSTAAGRRVARSPAVVPLPGPSRPSAHSLLVDSRVWSSRSAVARTVMDSSPRESISSSICSCCASLPRSLASVYEKGEDGEGRQGSNAAAHQLHTSDTNKDLQWNHGCLPPRPWSEVLPADS